MTMTCILALVGGLACATTSHEEPVGQSEPSPLADISSQNVEYLDINGVKHATLTVGRGDTKPVLLFLHGGPGNSAMPLAQAWVEPFVRHFVVVFWDQPGAGRSFEAGTSGQLTLSRLIDDAEKLVAHVAREGNGEVLVVGNSWGSVVGLSLVSTSTVPICGYAGVGQFTSARKTIEVMRSFLAERAGVDAAVGERVASLAEGDISGLLSAVAFAGGALYGKTGYDDEIEVRDSQPFAQTDLERRAEDQALSTQKLMPDLMAFDAFSLSPSVPTIVVQGVDDVVTPTSLATQWAKTRKPAVDVVVVDKAAHKPHYERPREVAKILASWASGRCDADH